MKKLAFTSLLAVLAVSGAHAGNIIDGNPLYRPAEGRFYSIHHWKLIPRQLMP